MNKQQIKVLLVEDHAVVRAGFRMLLSSQSFIGEIVDVDHGELATQEYTRFQPDVVVMDLSMPGIGGLETIRRLCKYDANATILVYSIHDETIYVERSLQAGAKGYVSKNSAAEVLAEAIAVVASGKRYIEKGLLPEINDVSEREFENVEQKMSTLTAREFDVFCLLAKGKTAHEISAELCLGYKTVSNYSTRIKNKLNASNSADLANIATAQGIFKHST